MAAYLIGTATVIDQEAWQEYLTGVAKTFEQYNGKILFRGIKTEVLAGTCEENLSVVIKFETIQQLKTWFDSKEYQELIPTRKKAALLNLTAYEG